MAQHPVNPFGNPFGAFAGGLASLDQARLWQGRLLDRLGLGPIETPSRRIFARPGVALRAYGGNPTGPVVLIVPAPIKRPYIWDLAPTVSVVRRCLDHGLRVYLAEWMDPASEIQDLGLGDYAGRLLLACLDAVAAETGREAVWLTGHSLGGTLAAIFAALHPSRVRGLVLLEAPLHFGPDAGAFAPLVAAVPDAGPIGTALGNVPGSFLDLASVAAAPATFLWERWLDCFGSVWDSRAIETHLRVERWTFDEFPLPGRLFGEVVELLYREDRFMRGTLRLGRRTAGPKGLEAPLLSVVDPRSRIIPPQSILPFLEAAPSRNKRLLRYEGDRGVALQHVGILVGDRAHRYLWPDILRWLRRADPIAPETPG